MFERLLCLLPNILLFALLRLDNPVLFAELEASKHEKEQRIRELTESCYQLYPLANPHPVFPPGTFSH